MKRRKLSTGSDIMVWKTDGGLFTVLARGIHQSSWQMFQGNPSYGSSIGPSDRSFTAFNAHPTWGERVAIKALPPHEQRFFRAYVACGTVSQPANGQVAHCAKCHNPLEYREGKSCVRCGHVIGKVA